MKKLSVDKEGAVYYDGKAISVKEINKDFLNSIFESSLKGLVEYEIDKTDPISNLFIRIQEETMPNSDFYKKVSELRNSYKKINEKEKKVKNAENENELLF